MVIGALSFRFFSHFGWKARFRGRSYWGLSGIGVPSYNSRQPSAVGFRQQESGIGVPSYNSRQPSVSVSKSRESEFPPTEELNSPKRRKL